MKKNRFKYLIYPQFQLTLILANAVSNFVFFILVSIGVRSHFASLFASAQKAGLSGNHIYLDFLKDQQNHLQSILLISLIVSLLITSCLLIWISHRLAGPLHRLNKHLLHSAETGQYSTIQFRKNDYFKEIATSLNQVFEKINQNESK